MGRTLSANRVSISDAQAPNTNPTNYAQIPGTTVSGQTTLPHTSAGQSYSCQVTLASAPPTGSAQITATIEPVPTEKNTQNNTQTFPVIFR